MPPRGAKLKGPDLSFDDLMDVYLNELAGTEDAGTVDLVTFLESPDWAGFSLRPRQRLISKIMNNAIATSSRDKEIPMLDWEIVRMDGRDWYTNHLEQTGERLVFYGMEHCIREDQDGAVWYDEAADYEYLLTRRNKYANIVVRLEGTPAEPLEGVWVIGRGGTKTTMASGLAGWRTHVVQAKANPFRYFGLDGRKPMKVQNVATAEKQAQEFFMAFKTLVGRITWFKGRFSDLENSIDFGEIPTNTATKVPQMIAELQSSNSRSARGGDTIDYYHDEMAFTDRSGDGKAGHRSDRAMHKAFYGAVKTRAKCKGLAMYFSSPFDADGLFYQLFQQAESGVLRNVVLIQIATWEMIPGQRKQDYDKEYADDPDGAEMEYGAQFYTGSSNLIPGAWEKLQAAVENGKKLGLLRRRHAYFEDLRVMRDGRYDLTMARPFDYACHLDLSSGGDRLVMAICHMEGPYTVLDYLQVWDELPHFTRELEPLIVKLDRAFHGFRIVTFDQHMSLQMIQNLKDQGIRAEKRDFTKEYNDAIARNLMQVLSASGVTLAIYPTRHGRDTKIPDRGTGWHQDPAQEADMSMYLAWREIEAAKKLVKAAANSGNKKYLITGVAPSTGEITHDDALDAIAAAAYEARMLVMGGGKADFLDAQGGQGAYIDPYAIPDDRQGEVEVYAAEHTIAARCLHCYHAWNEKSPDSFVECPSCHAITQVRM